MNKPVIGFIGTGVMGKSMAARLLDEGYQLNIFTRTYEKAVPLLDKGATWKDSVQSLAKDSEVIITMVGYPQDVEEVYFGEQGLIENAASSTYLIDMTTSSPDLAKQIDQEARKREVRTLDAPVSGGDIGAKNGKLSIMTGGDKEDFEHVKEIFEVLGSQIVLQGPSGSGQHTKMANQIAIATNMIGVTEALVYAEAAGLDPDTLLESISGGAAGSWSLSNLTPRVIKRDFSPGFFVKHFIKDMGIALETAEKMEIDLPGLKLAKQMYDRIAKDGEADSGTQALYKYYQ